MQTTRSLRFCVLPLIAVLYPSRYLCRYHLFHRLALRFFEANDWTLLSTAKWPSDFVQVLRKKNWSIRGDFLKIRTNNPHCNRSLLQKSLLRKQKFLPRFDFRIWLLCFACDHVFLVSSPILLWWLVLWGWVTTFNTTFPSQRVIVKELLHCQMISLMCRSLIIVTLNSSLPWRMQHIGC